MPTLVSPMVLPVITTKIKVRAGIVSKRGVTPAFAGMTTRFEMN